MWIIYGLLVPLPGLPELLHLSVKVNRLPIKPITELLRIEPDGRTNTEA
jgi:hypothetical protein